MKMIQVQLSNSRRFTKSLNFYKDIFPECLELEELSKNINPLHILTKKFSSILDETPKIRDDASPLLNQLEGKNESLEKYSEDDLVANLC